jgi:hypothetical protein
MSDPIDWKSTTWRENRRRQHREFQSLSFREKMKRIEEMAEVAARFRRRVPTEDRFPRSGSGSDD